MDDFDRCRSVLLRRRLDGVGRLHLRRPGADVRSGLRSDLRRAGQLRSELWHELRLELRLLPSQQVLPPQVLPRSLLQAQVLPSQVLWLPEPLWLRWLWLELLQHLRPDLRRSGQLRPDVRRSRELRSRLWPDVRRSRELLQLVLRAE